MEILIISKRKIKLEKELISKIKMNINEESSFLNLYSYAPDYLIEFDNFTTLALERFSGICC